MYWQVMILVLMASPLIAMDKQQRYDQFLSTSLYEDIIPDKDGRNMAVAVFISSLENEDKKTIFNSDLVRKIIEELPPEIFNELISHKPRESCVVENQLYITQELIKYLRIQLDNASSSQRQKEYRDTIDFLENQKKKITTCAQGATMCSMFWFLCTMMIVYYYVAL